ncbi:MAG TPA: cell division protein FtsQ/DivIB [Patescibacteria group bacterium]
MNKNKLHKRKLRRIIKVIIFLFFIFLATICILFLCSVTIFKKKQIVLTPIGSVKNVQTDNQKMSPEVSDTMQKLFDQFHLSVESINTGTDSATHILFSSGQEIVLSENKAMETQLASLQLIMNRLTIEGKQFNRIDLRFDNPVINF